MSGETRLPSSSSPSLQTLVSGLFLYGCLGCISAFSDATRNSSSRYSASGLSRTLPECAFFYDTAKHLHYLSVQQG